jgi:hypothetical protein
MVRYYTITGLNFGFRDGHVPTRLSFIRYLRWSLDTVYGRMVDPQCVQRRLRCLQAGEP